MNHESLSDALAAIEHASMILAEVQATRHPRHGRTASLAITHLEDARYRVLDLICESAATPADNSEAT